MATHNDLGKHGERLASQYLKRKGYEILAENWIHGKAEIDIISRFNGQIIFVEVKTRSSSGFGFPEDFVDDAKVQRLDAAAAAYIESINYEGEVRFDIIAILFNHENTPAINHIEDAFWAT